MDELFLGEPVAGSAEPVGVPVHLPRAVLAGQTVGKDMNLKIVSYQHRHSGASNDQISRRRSSEEIMK